MFGSSKMEFYTFDGIGPGSKVALKVKFNTVAVRPYSYSNKQNVNIYLEHIFILKCDDGCGKEWKNNDNMFYKLPAISIPFSSEIKKKQRTNNLELTSESPMF